MAEGQSGAPFYQKLSAYPLMDAQRRQELLEQFFNTQIELIDALVAYLVPLYRYFAQELERRNAQFSEIENTEGDANARVSRLKASQLKQIARLLMELKDAQEQGQSATVDTLRVQLRELLVGFDYSLLSTIASSEYTRPVQAFVETKEQSEKTAKKIDELVAHADEDREALFNGNWRLVMEIARRFEAFGSKLELDELVQEGNTGLLAAIDKFNPRLNFQLSTVAANWIQAKIRRAMDNQSETIRTPVYKRQRKKLVQKAESELLAGQAAQASEKGTALELMTNAEKLFGRVVEDEAIAQKTGLTLEEVKELRRLYPETVSLNAAVDGSEDSDSRERQDIIADKAQEETSYDKSDRALFLKMLTKMVDDLPLGHQVVLSALNGLPVRKEVYRRLVLARLQVLKHKGQQLLRGVPLAGARPVIEVFR